LAASSSSRRKSQLPIVIAVAHGVRSVAAYVARLFPIARFVVADESMQPAYRPGDRLALNRLAYLLRGPRVGDVVVLRDPEMPSRYLVKRIARAGRGPSRARRYEVLGENAPYSRDSRAFGAVPRRSIIGKVWFKY
jgi:nickel-type superoxide dismutase maturation protease